MPTDPNEPNFQDLVPTNIRAEVRDMIIARLAALYKEHRTHIEAIRDGSDDIALLLSSVLAQARALATEVPALAQHAETR
jgi:hypothetical protein